MSDLDTMPAGPELDLQIALRVMGWADARLELTTGYGECRVCISASSRVGIFAPSRGMGPAWLAVEKLRALGHEVIVATWEGDRALGNFYALCTMPDGHDTGQILADTAPLAICRAALKAMR